MGPLHGGDELAWVVRGRAAPSVLDSYDQERRPHAARMIALAGWMGWLVMPQTRVSALALHGGVHLLRGLPQFRSFIDDMGLKPVNSFREGLFAGGRGAVQRGSWFPQGQVRDVAGDLALSDDLLGPGFSVVGMGANPADKLPPSTARAWSDAGGTFVEVRPRGRAPNREASEDLTTRWCRGPRRSAGAWCSGRIAPSFTTDRWQTRPPWCMSRWRSFGGEEALEGPRCSGAAVLGGKLREPPRGAARSRLRQAVAPAPRSRAPR